MDTSAFKGKWARYTFDSVMILAGIIIAFWPEAIKGVIVKILAVLALCYGTIVLLKAISKEKPQQYVYYAGGGLMLLAGILMIIASEFFFGLIVFIMGAIVCYLGMSALVSMFRVGKRPMLPLWYMAFPIAIIFCGTFMFFYPGKSGNIMFVLFGIVLIVFGCGEILLSVFNDKKLSEAKEKISGAASEFSNSAGKVMDIVKDDVSSQINEVVQNVKDAKSAFKNGIKPDNDNDD